MNTYKVITGEGESRKVTTGLTIVGALKEVFNAKQDGQTFAVYNEITGRNITSSLSPIITDAVKSFDSTSGVRQEHNVRVGKIQPYDLGLGDDFKRKFSEAFADIKFAHFRSPAGPEFIVPIHYGLDFGDPYHYAQIVIYPSSILPSGTIYSSADVYDKIVKYFAEKKEGL